MTSLFSDFSMIWLTKSLAKRARKARRDTIAPFKVLHAIQWSAPWQIGGT